MGNAESGITCCDCTQDNDNLQFCQGRGEHGSDPIRSLTGLGADVMLSDPNRGTPIGILCRHIRDRDINALEKYLEEDKSSVHVTDANGRTALHFAVLAKNHAAAEVLVRHGVDVETTADDGKTASALAAEIPDSQMVKLLLDLRKGRGKQSEQDTPTRRQGDVAYHRIQPMKRGEAVISPHLTGAVETGYSRYYTKVDERNKKAFSNRYDKKVTEDRINSITPETRIRIMERQAKDNQKIVASRLSELKNSWDDPNTHGFMLVKSGTQSNDFRECLSRRTPWGGVAHLETRENDILGAMKISTDASRAIHLLSSSDQLKKNSSPLVTLRDDIGLSEANKARDQKVIVPYNKRKGWSSKGLPTPPGLHRPETEFTTGARRFAEM